MRVLLPLACVALLVVASGAFADLTPLPESEWGSVVGGQVPLPSPPPPDPPPVDPPIIPEPLPIEWTERIDPGDWQTIFHYVCAGTPAQDDIPIMCQGTETGCYNVYDLEGTFLYSVQRELGTYKVCTPQSGTPALSCSQGVVPCAHILAIWDGVGCSGLPWDDPAGTPLEWADANGCQLVSVKTVEDETIPVPEPE